MINTRAVPRNLRKTTARVAAAAAAAAARLQRPAAGIGVKSIENIRCRNKDVKIKKLLARPKNIEVKRRGRLVRKMTVRRRAIFPPSRWQRQY